MELLRYCRLFIMFFLFVPYTCIAGGLSAWTEYTPYGYEMYHDGTANSDIYLRMDTVGVSFKHFYFYKSHIIAHNDSLFFIINELTNEVQRFTDETEWKNELTNQKLEPLWKREYNVGYSSAFGSGLIWLILLPFPLLLPLIWFICLISLLFPGRFLLGFRKFFSWAYPLIFFILWLFAAFPQSI